MYFNYLAAMDMTIAILYQTRLFKVLMKEIVKKSKVQNFYSIKFLNF